MVFIRKLFIGIMGLVLSLLFSVQLNAASYHMHTVKTGETYYSIANSCGGDVNTLESINYQPIKNLKPGDLIKINQIKDINIKVNGENISFDRDPYIENERVFVPIRFLSDALNVDDISWNQETKTAVITKENKSIVVTVGSDIAHVNGQAIKLDAPVQLYIDRTFVPIRFISEAFDVDKLEWDSNNYTVFVEKEEIAAPPQLVTEYQESTNYSEEDLYWLSRLVHAESEAEPYEGKLAVANTIINRKNSPIFPNTIKGVIFDTKYAVQYTPVANGHIYDTPNEDSIKAAREALEGNNNVGNSLYFINPKKSTNSWVNLNRTYYKTIQNHDFYL